MAAGDAKAGGFALFRLGCLHCLFTRRRVCAPEPRLLCRLPCGANLTVMRSALLLCLCLIAFPACDSGEEAPDPASIEGDWFFEYSNSDGGRFLSITPPRVNDYDVSGTDRSNCTSLTSFTIVQIDERVWGRRLDDESIFRQGDDLIAYGRTYERTNKSRDDLFGPRRTC